MANAHNLIANLKLNSGQFDKNLKKSRTGMTRFGKGVQNMGKQMLAIAGIGGGIYMVSRGMRGMVSATAEQERAEKLLTAATKGSIETFKKFAAETQKLTIYGDEQILSQMAYAKNLGVSTDQLEEATTAAVGLAAKYRLDLATSMMLVGRASQGQTQMLTRYGIVLKESLSASEKFNAVLKIGAEAFGLAKEEAKDAIGTWKQFKNAVGDTAEELGGPLLEKGTKALRWMIDVNETIKENLELQKNQTFPFMTPPESFWDLQKGTRPLTEEQEFEAFAKKWRPKIADISKQIKDQNIQRTQAIEISKTYLANVNKEIQLTGLVGEARQHAAKMIEMQTKFQTAGIEKTMAAVEESKKLDAALTKLGERQKWARIADDIGGAFADAFTDMIFEAKRFGDAMKALMKDIARSVVRNVITTPLANSITMALGGVPAAVGHSGGTFGSIGARRNVPSATFAGAPRLHGGLKGDEFPAILQKGEEVIPKGGGGGGTTVIINNNTGQKMKQDGPAQFNGREMVIQIVADDVQSGGQLSKLFKR